MKPAEVPDEAVWVGSYARTDEQRQLIQFLYAAADLGRPVVMSRQVPEDRIAIMRKAFDATVKDQAFLDDMKKQDQPVQPISGEEAEKILARFFASASPAMVAKARGSTTSSRKGEGDPSRTWMTIGDDGRGRQVGIAPVSFRVGLGRGAAAGSTGPHDASPCGDTRPMGATGRRYQSKPGGKISSGRTMRGPSDCSWT